MKRWRSGEEAIPDWARTALSLLGYFRKSAREAPQRREPAVEPGVVRMEPRATHGAAAKRQ